MRPVPPENYLVTPFITNKSQIYTYTYLSASNVPQISIDLAVVPPPVWNFYPNSDPINPDGIYQHSLYASVMQMFYATGSGYGITYTYIPTGSQFYVVSMAQQSYGEQIKPGSFRVFSSTSTGSLQDDGNGNIYGTNTGSIVGNIFYGMGIAVIQQTTSSLSSSLVTGLGMFLNTGSVVTVEYDAVYTIYEHQIMCTIDVGELNYSSNPSITAPSSSVSGNGTIKVYDAFASGTLTPYMTTIGAYTNNGELVAVGKFPNPVKRAVESQQTIIMRFDI